MLAAFKGALSTLTGMDCEERNGEWSATFGNGCVYQGEWHGGLPHGRGTLRWPDGTTYTGDVTKGEITGEGSYYYPSGVEFHGQVLGGVRHGEVRQTLGEIV